MIFGPNATKIVTPVLPVVTMASKIKEWWLKPQGHFLQLSMWNVTWVAWTDLFFNFIRRHGTLNFVQVSPDPIFHAGLRPRHPIDNWDSLVSFPCNHGHSRHQKSPQKALSYFWHLELWWNAGPRGGYARISYNPNQYGHGRTNHTSATGSVLWL